DAKHGLKKVNKPRFWTYVDKEKNREKKKKKQEKYIDYNCPMDHLYITMKKLDNAEHHENLYLEDLLVDHDAKKADRKQEDKIYI
ncbi:hypothetical protein, partial [Paenibacillus elgii]|uniref:hypothetical protein n=1 Tax=Paenibacillus elgii TaxID=189691 RepID=UPI00203CAA49